MYQNNFKYITVLFAFSESLRYAQLSEITPKHFLMGTRAIKFQSSEELSVKTQLGKVSSSVSFHHYFQVFHILLQNLFSVLLEMISFEKIFKRVAQKFPIISVKSFSPLVTRTFGGFLPNT